MTIKRVAVYCGSRPGHDPAFAKAARELAETLASAGIGIIYGGSNTGLMGIIADTALAAGGEAIGVMPEHAGQKERAHPGLSQLHMVADMHARKAMMAELADAFIALPGGIGTLDELVEVWSLKGLGYHQKPCICYDVAGFWQPLLALLTHFHQQGFAWSDHQPHLTDNPQALLAILRADQDN